MSIQLLGILAGSPVFPKQLEDFGFFVLAMQPDLLTPRDEFAKKVSTFSEAMRKTKRADEKLPVRMPFERSAHGAPSSLPPGEQTSTSRPLGP